MPFISILQAVKMLAARYLVVIRGVKSQNCYCQYSTCRNEVLEEQIVVIGYQKYLHIHLQIHIREIAPALERIKGKQAHSHASLSRHALNTHYLRRVLWRPLLSSRAQSDGEVNQAVKATQPTVSQSVMRLFERSGSQSECKKQQQQPLQHQPVHVCMCVLVCICNVIICS